MISEIAWENFRWLRVVFFDNMVKMHGRLMAVEHLRPYFKRRWVKRLRPATARGLFLKEIAAWSKDISETRLTKRITRPNWNPGESLQVVVGGKETSALIDFLFRSQYNLCSLATSRRTIEELALGSYAYCSTTIRHTKEFDKRALADFRRLLRVSKSFLLAEWVHDMIDRAICNRDDALFRILSNSVRAKGMAEPSPVAVQWVFVLVLWYLGGNDMKPQREFLQLLKREKVLPASTTETSFNVMLYVLGLTRT